MAQYKNLLTGGMITSRRDFGKGLAAILAAGSAPAICKAALLGARGVAMGEGKLPYDAEVEYIESSGTQYVDCGFIPDYTTEVDLYFDLQSQTISYLFGVTSNNYNTNVYCFSMNPSEPRRGYYRVFAAGNTGVYGYGNVGSAFNAQRVSSHQHMTNHYCEIDGIRYNYAEIFNYGFNITRNFYMFARNNNGNADYYISGKFRSCTISNRISGEIIRDFMPVRKGNIGYLYDKSHPQGGPNGNGLYGNSGTGYFDFPGRVS